MKYHNANVIIYVKQPVEQGQLKRISNIVSSMRGVLNTEVSIWKKSFFSVDYDPSSTDSKHILNCVKDQGYSAVLVGM